MKNIERQELYKQYLEECEEIAEQCREEGYPSHGSNYELRVAEAYKFYFGDDDKDEEEEGYEEFDE